MTTRGGWRPDPRTVGLLIAAVLAGCVLVVISWVLVHSSSAPPVEKVVQDFDFPEFDPLVPINEDVVDSSETRIRLMDKQDPTRTATLIMGDLNPLESHRHAVSNPSAWHYLTDGRSMHVQSASGEWYMPSREDGPESGQLEGGWLIRIYDPHPEPIDLEIDVPTLRATGDAPLEFNTTTGRLETRGRVEVVTQDVEFRCEDVQVVANEISERLEYFIARRGEHIRYRVPTSATNDGSPAIEDEVTDAAPTPPPPAT
ncbi:MAG: hypothetical protein KDA28_00765, partial [Phycisphaerales bacterium]|nr:hypothetical protein [Phycisphaerales bacterium]